MVREVRRIVGNWHIADGLAPARTGQVSGVVPPFAERTLATTECFDFGDQCTVLPTRNGDYGRSREVAPATAGERWSYAKSRAQRQGCCGFGVSLPVPESLAVRYCRSLEARAMDFRLSKAQQRLHQKYR